MITFFTTAKPFRGHSAVIQRNALQSWKLLHQDIEVILFGDEEGAKEIARELSLRHEPEVARDPAGLPYLNSMFDRAEEIASHDVLCYINCDIILTSDFPGALARVREASANFLMVGRRWDTDISQAIDFSDAQWEPKVRQIAIKANDRRDCWSIDYFLFRRGMLSKKIPGFVVGRFFWDNWLVWRVLQMGAPVVDASATVLAIHQNHVYAHPLGVQGVWGDDSFKRNLAILGSWRYRRAITDATTKLTRDGLKRNWARSWYAARRVSQLLWWQAKRKLTFEICMPAWHFCLNATRPLRARLGLRSKANRQSDATQKEFSSRADGPS